MEPDEKMISRMMWGALIILAVVGLYIAFVVI